MHIDISILAGHVILSFLVIMSDALAKPSSRRSRQKLRPLSQRKNDPLAVERDVWKDYKYLVGSDDSGQGCIAGPIVTVSLAICTPRDVDQIPVIAGVEDSKLLSQSSRLAIFDAVVADPQTYVWSLAVRSNVEIDEGGLQNMTMSCFNESIWSVASQLDTDTSSIYSIVDGKRSPVGLGIATRPWVKGDLSVYTIALASVLARVEHDRIMTELASLYPSYGLDRNGGYPSPQHTQALHEFGISPIHRQSTKPVVSRKTHIPRSTFVSLCAASLVQSFFSQPTEAVTRDQNGVSLPDVGEIEAAVPNDWDSIDNPVTDAVTSLSRLDSSDDSIFYGEARFVEHVDEQAVRRMTDYISNKALGERTNSVLDLCSSWTSHIDASKWKPIGSKRVAGLGMNAEELEKNPALTEWIVRDLNKAPSLPYPDKTFDVVLCQLSIDYLTKPIEVFSEVSRVLKDNGTVHILFSNRLFLSKAVALWTGADDIDHVFTVASYLRFSEGNFKDIQATDLSFRSGRQQRIVGDPLYVVTAST